MSNIKEVEEELKEFEFVEDNEYACGLIVKIKTDIDLKSKALIDYNDNVVENNDELLAIKMSEIIKIDKRIIENLQ
jgi:hypothetical protein